jgi:hypothetical protein
MLRAAPGEEAFAAVLDWAVAFSRWRAADVRSILAAGDPLVGSCPGPGPVRPLADYAPGRLP